MKPTPGEATLWQALRTNQTGFHFRRQQVIQPFIVDFYCHEAAVVVEVDGDIHDLRVEADQQRSEHLIGLGLEVIRFRNEEVLRNAIRVVARIHETCLLRSIRSKLPE
jgi:very-short-patch-repair endonuclease